MVWRTSDLREPRVDPVGTSGSNLAIDPACLVWRRYPGSPTGIAAIPSGSMIAVNPVASEPQVLPIGSKDTMIQLYYYPGNGSLTPHMLQAMLMHCFYGERMVTDGDAAAAAQVKSRAEARVGGLLDQLDAQLASHGAEWLLGPTFSARSRARSCRRRLSEAGAGESTRDHLIASVSSRAILARASLRLAVTAIDGKR